MAAPKSCGAKGDKTEACGSAQSECTRTVYQYACVSVPVKLVPKAEIDGMTAELCGEPVVECRPCECGGGFEIYVTQRLSITMPITYRISACEGECSICCRE